MVESHPDTIITLTNGKKYVVAESEDEVRDAIIHFYRSVNVLGFQKDVEDFENEE